MLGAHPCAPPPKILLPTCQSRHHSFVIPVEDGNGLAEADMTRHTSKQTVKSFVGSALVGPGLSIFFGNLLWAAAQLSHLLGQTAGESLGVLPLVPWAASLGPSATPAHSAAHVLAPPAPHRRSRPARRRARRRPIDRPKLSNSSPVGGHVWPGYQPRVPHSCAFLCIKGETKCAG